MRLARLLLALIAVAATPLPALQLQEVTLQSPITGRPFHAMVLPARGAASSEQDPSLADMGADDDGCRHTSGLSEYDYYVATCPYSYFSALTAEWDERAGFDESRPARFLGEIPPKVKEWVAKDFNSDWNLDVNNAFKLAQVHAKAAGHLPPERNAFVMSQQAIPVYRKYHNALLCYEKRGARAAVLAKIALTGAWAMRTRFNVPINHDQLTGGIEEINDRLSRHIKDNEGFELRKWTEIYGRIFSKPEVKTNEAVLLAGLVYHGFLVRAGDHAAAEGVLDKLMERFEDVEKGGELLRGLVRERRDSYRKYRTFLDLAARKFIVALKEEEFSRPRLPEVLLVVAEALRRGDQGAEAAHWYLALSQMAETQPKLRADIRAAGKAPGPEAPYHVQLGWLADQHLGRLAEAGVAVGDVPAGGDGRLLNAILFEGFGTAEFRNPDWKPIAGATQKECLMILDHVGKSVLEFKLRLGQWPTMLEDLWTRDLIRDRNLYNRFHCPVSGKPLRYDPQSGELAQRTALVVTPDPVQTPSGPRYGVYMANNEIVWIERAVNPGEILGK